jgi:P-loop Domain of unknown function (DUF2791)
MSADGERPSWRSDCYPRSGNRTHGSARSPLPICGWGGKVRDLYAAASDVPDRIADRAEDAYIGDLADAVTGALGGKVGVPPRVFLKKLVADVLDRVDQFEDFDPRRHYALTLAATELTDKERNATALSLPSGRRAGDVELDLP